MQRRKFIIGAGALASGSAAAVGTGAFSSVEAERTIDLSTEDDSNALLEITLNNDYDGDGEEYVTETSDGRFEIAVDNLNREAVTRFEDLFTVANTGGQDLDLWINVDFGADTPNDDEQDPIRGAGSGGSDGPVEIEYNGDSIIGGTQQQAETTAPLNSGESVDLTVEVDTRDINEDEEVSSGASNTTVNELEGEYQFVAE